MRKVLPLVVGIVVMAVAACGGGEETTTDVGEQGERPVATEATTTTTEVEVTTTTLPLQVTEAPAPQEWGADWPGPDVPVEPGALSTGEFNTFVNEEAPAGTTPEEAVSVYLQLDPTDPNVQMLSGPRGGPESTRVVVIVSTPGDDSTRAVRYEFAVEERNRAAEDIATEETEDAQTGDTSEDADELDTNAGDAATEDDLAVEEGPDTVPTVLSVEVTVQCQPGRGAQDFTLALCV